MNAVGIIAEYNPFHNGHLYHLTETKRRIETDCIVAVMSGNFTQRGEPALADKWIRAETAIKNGIDLVIELPFAFACNNAEFFAKGAVDILDGLGCVSHFSFGSEDGSINSLIEAAEALAFENDDFRNSLREYLNKGYSYPKARFEALKKHNGSETAAVITKPNNILAVEYLKESMRINSKMIPVTVKREGAGYHDKCISGEFASASGIREKIKQHMDLESVRDVITEKTAEILDRQELKDIITSHNLFELLVYKVITADIEELKGILSAGEGLENKLKRAAAEAKDIEGLFKAVKSKRYTETRIQRLFIHTLTGLTKEDFFRILEEKILYARILGISRKGAELLRYIKKTGCNKVPIINNINKELEAGDPLWSLLKYDIIASDIYNLLRYGEIYSNSDFVHRLYVQ